MAQFIILVAFCVGLAGLGASWSPDALQAATGHGVLVANVIWAVALAMWRILRH